MYLMHVQSALRSMCISVARIFGTGAHVPRLGNMRGGPGTGIYGKFRPPRWLSKRSVALEVVDGRSLRWITLVRGAQMIKFLHS